MLRRATATPILKYTWIDFVSDFPSGQEEAAPPTALLSCASEKFLWRCASRRRWCILSLYPRPMRAPAKGTGPGSRYVIQVSGEHSNPHRIQNVLNCKLHTSRAFLVAREKRRDAVACTLMARLNDLTSPFDDTCDFRAKSSRNSL